MAGQLRTALVRGNAMVTGFQYDNVSRLQQLTQDPGGTARDLTLGFAYNPASQIITTTRSNDVYAWTGHGSGTTSTSANGLNQIAGWAGSLDYDPKGNVASHGSWAYTYSSENLLTSFTNSEAGALQASSTFAYDPLMRLAVIDSSNSTFDASLAYDGQEIVFEALSNNRTRRYVFGPGTDEPLMAYLTQSGGTFRNWYYADERGSILGQTDDTGAPLGSGGPASSFDEYGVGAGTSRFRYTGQYWLGGHLHYYRARIYDAGLGRFLQPDPIGYGGGMNMYAYVGGDPVNLTDSSGLAPNCGLESNWRSGNCADMAVGYEIRKKGEANGYSDSDIRAATSRVLDYLHGRADYAGTALALLQIEAVVNARQSAGNKCSGRFQCEDTPTTKMRTELIQLFGNSTFQASVRYIEGQSNRTGNEWGFTGKGRGDFSPVGGYIEGTKDWIATKTIAQRAEMGADLFFHIHPNSGRGYAPGLSYGVSQMLYGGDLGVAYNYNILVGAFALSNRKFYWFDGRGIKR